MTVTPPPRLHSAALRLRRSAALRPLTRPRAVAACAVIKGWDVGVMKMSLGEKAVLFIGPDYGYGASGNGPIPPNASLKFEVELLRIERGIQRDGAMNHEFDQVAKQMLGQAGHPGAA